jgi:predicted RNA methylase
LICGAEKCLFIEHNPNTLQLCKIIVNELWLINNSEFLLIDATTWNPNSKFDLLISETIESTLNFEDFPKIINNLRNYWTKNSIIIPEEFEVILKWENWFYDSKNFICKNWFNKISINIPNNLNEIEFSSNIRLYWNNYIKTHDTYSFVNQRIWKLENKHNFLEFKKN